MLRKTFMIQTTEAYLTIVIYDCKIFTVQAPVVDLQSKFVIILHTYELEQFSELETIVRTKRVNKFAPIESRNK